MARLMIGLLFVAVLAGLASGAGSAMSRAVVVGHRRLNTAKVRGGAMQKISGMLLVALIVYVAIWGSA